MYSQLGLKDEAKAFYDQILEKYPVDNEPIDFPGIRIYKAPDGQAWDVNDVCAHIWAQRSVNSFHHMYHKH